MSDDQLRGYFRGCDGFVFAAGVDERVECPHPICELYGKYKDHRKARNITLYRG